MQASSLPRQSAVGRLHGDPKLTQVNVVVYTADCIFAGYAYRLPDQRLLDAINKGFVAQSMRVGKDFVPLSDVEVFFQDGRKTRLASTYIRKTNIIFVGEKDERPHGLPAIEDRSKLHLKKKKKPIVTEVHVPSYALVGKMHAEVWQELLDTIETDEGFLPMTNVKISPALISGESKFSFVAINKDQVIYIGESLA
jgi:hypothetical protein